MAAIGARRLVLATIVESRHAMSRFAFQLFNYVLKTWRSLLIVLEC